MTHLDITQLATVFGLLGVLANVCWPLMRERKSLLAGQVLACVFMLTHFALLDARTGSVIMAVAGIQALLAIPLESNQKFKYIYLGSLIFTPIVCIATWQGAPSVFSSLALAIVCIANFQLNQVHQRALLIMAIFAWFAHNLLVVSVPGIISNVLAFVVSVRMLVLTARTARFAQFEAR